jgi:hypothetical protein
VTVEKKTYVISRRDLAIYDPALAYVGIKLLTVDGTQFDPVANPPLSNREYQHDVSGGFVYVNVEPFDEPLTVNIIIAY